jgi:hypothetical protein
MIGVVLVLLSYDSAPCSTGVLRSLEAISNPVLLRYTIVRDGHRIIFYNLLFYVRSIYLLFLITYYVLDYLVIYSILI